MFKYDRLFGIYTITVGFNGESLFAVIYNRDKSFTKSIGAPHTPAIYNTKVINRFIQDYGNKLPINISHSLNAECEKLLILKINRKTLYKFTSKYRFFES